MLRERPNQHKRKNSQLDLFYPSSHKSDQPQSQKSKPKKSTNDKKLRLSLEQNKANPNSKNILKLVENSQKRHTKKSTVVEDINEENQWGNENIDSSNGAYIGNNDNDESNDTYFQFGRRSRCSSVKKQNYDVNYGYLNMEEITEVPDTMSNERRYETTNFYAFPTSNQNSLINFSNRLIDEKSGQKASDTLESQAIRQTLAAKFIEQSINLKKRKQKLPKNIVIQGDQVQEKFDLSELSKQNKKSKLFFVNKKQDKRQKSKENLAKVEKDKSKSSLFLTKKSKNFSQTTLGGKKKSLSLKSDMKNHLKIIDKKPKSFQKPKQTSQSKSSQHLFTKPSKSQKSSIIHQTLNSSNPKSLQIGQKIMMIEQSQSKLQNQYKILWQCMGELWENSRITRYISEKNKSDIVKLKEGEKGQDQKMIKLKSQILSSIASARY